MFKFVDMPLPQVNELYSERSEDLFHRTRSRLEELKAASDFEVVLSASDRISIRNLKAIAGKAYSPKAGKGWDEVRRRIERMVYCNHLNALIREHGGEDHAAAWTDQGKRVYLASSSHPEGANLVRNGDKKAIDQLDPNSRLIVSRSDRALDVVKRFRTMLNEKARQECDTLNDQCHDVGYRYVISDWGVKKLKFYHGVTR